VVRQWNPEVQHFCSGVPKLLVGLKLDLRNDPNTIKELAKVGQKPVSQEQVRGGAHVRTYMQALMHMGGGLVQGQAIATQIHAYRYMECSSKTRQGVREVFEHATRAALTAQKTKRRNCTVL
jgi:Ras homolog gene family, member A